MQACGTPHPPPLQPHGAAARLLPEPQHPPGACELPCFIPLQRRAGVEVGNVLPRFQQQVDVPADGSQARGTRGAGARVGDKLRYGRPPRMRLQRAQGGHCPAATPQKEPCRRSLRGCGRCMATHGSMPGPHLQETDQLLLGRERPPTCGCPTASTCPGLPDMSRRSTSAPACTWKAGSRSG